VIAVVKANVYGHGSVPIARCLEAHGYSHFGVVTAQEGEELRNAGIKGYIQVLGMTRLNLIILSYFREYHLINIDGVICGNLPNGETNNVLLDQPFSCVGDNSYSLHGKGSDKMFVVDFPKRHMSKALIRRRITRVV